MIKRDHISPNVSRAKLIGQSERLWCVCFIINCLPRLLLVIFDDVSRDGSSDSHLTFTHNSPPAESDKGERGVCWGHPRPRQEASLPAPPLYEWMSALVFFVFVFFVARRAANRGCFYLLGQLVAQRIIFVHVGCATHHRILEATGDDIGITTLCILLGITSKLIGLRLTHSRAQALSSLISRCLTAPG